MNWTLVGLNWTVSLKSFEKTFVVIWRNINKTELLLIELQRAAEKINLIMHRKVLVNQQEMVVADREQKT